MAKKPVSLAGVSMMGIGTIFVFAGLKGMSVMVALQNLITGQPIGLNSSLQSLTTADAGIEEAPAISGVSPAAGGLRQLGKTMAQLYGWTGAEWDALDKLWTRESSWNNKAENPSSKAYGIPQALPPTKLPKAGQPERLGGKSDPAAQIQWGLSYIKGRYGRPSMAWAHETSNGWY